MSKSTKYQIINGEWQTTVRIPEKLLKYLEEGCKLGQVVFNTLVCDALQHYCFCPIDSPKGTLERMGSLINELRGRVSKLELVFQKAHPSRLN